MLAQTSAPERRNNALLSQFAGPIERALPHFPDNFPKNNHRGCVFIVVVILNEEKKEEMKKKRRTHTFPQARDSASGHLNFFSNAICPA
jgi:hypothetical protein